MFWTSCRARREKDCFVRTTSGFCQSTQKYFHEDTKAMTDVTDKMSRTEDRHAQLARVLPRDYPKILRTTAFPMSRFPWTANSSQPTPFEFRITWTFISN
jgi:hypothetical protein